MISVTFRNDKGTHVIKSNNVEENLRLMGDLDYVEDISDSISQKNIMIFDCRLDKAVFRFENPDEDVSEELEEEDPYMQVLFEDIKMYLKDVSEDIEVELKQIYKYEGIKSWIEIYDVDETFTDIKFVLSVSFKQIERKELRDLTMRMAKKQLLGSSKYFN